MPPDQQRPDQSSRNSSWQKAKCRLSLAIALSTIQVTEQFSSVEGEDPGSSQMPSTSLPLPPTSPKDLQLDGYLKYPHAAKALYIYKHPSYPGFEPRSNGPAVSVASHCTGLTESVENVGLSPPVQHNASPNDNSRTPVTVSLSDVTKMKPCADLSPNQLTLRIPRGSETTLLRKEVTTPLMRRTVFFCCSPCTTLNGAFDDYLSKGCRVQRGERIGLRCEDVLPL
ncbi:hypothetical protein TNCV_5085521 [Trichonephila clavipes]|uniref:Uncharacterized protein n=1 Tax=Trichonephila clavipes TaxID=2585209 RepID=A0A8X6S4L5_TRICX|nr:hypothetical protein TNCV_5085521 [Trichonephila clavipes]